MSVVISLAASYVVAMTVVPLFCSKYLKLNNPEHLSETDSAEARTLRGKPGWVKLGEGSESYAPLSRALVGGLTRVGGADCIPGSGRLPLGLRKGGNVGGS